MKIQYPIRASVNRSVAVATENRRGYLSSQDDKFSETTLNTHNHLPSRRKGNQEQEEEQMLNVVREGKINNPKNQVAVKINKSTTLELEEGELSSENENVQIHIPMKKLQRSSSRSHHHMEVR